MKRVTENTLLENYDGLTIGLDKISIIGMLRIVWSYRGENGAAVDFRKDANSILIEDATDESLVHKGILLGKRFSKRARAGMTQSEKDMIDVYKELG